MLRYKCEQIHNKNRVKLFPDVSDFREKKSPAWTPGGWRVKDISRRTDPGQGQDVYPDRV
ncbi:hypothetical protein MRY16398_07580 [Phytobacter sp. MRY16-398]|nr:hypothetical protein MRY16398_07580 [Phytobacter sp. MRY16-398]